MSVVASLGATVSMLDVVIGWWWHDWPDRAGRVLRRLHSESSVEDLTTGLRRLERRPFCCAENFILLHLICFYIILVSVFAPVARVSMTEL